MERKKVFIATGVAIALLTGGSYLVLKADNFSKSNSGSQSNNSKNQSTNGKTPTAGPAIEITTPTEGDSLRGNLTLRGTSLKSGGKLYYEVKDQEGELLAEGVIVTEGDEEESKAFTAQISFIKKPISGGSGVLRILDAGKNEVQSIGVTF